MSTVPPTGDATTTTDNPAALASALNYANTTISQSIQTLNLVQQARLSQQNRNVALLTVQYGADSSQVKTAQAIVTASRTTIARISAVKQQVALTPPQVTATGWAIYGHIYNSALAPASAYTVFLVDEQNAYQSAVGFTYTVKDGSFHLNYSGAENEKLASQLFLQVVNSKGQPVYLSTTAFQPQAGVATYQDVTLPAGEPVLGDPPARIRAIAFPDTKKP